MNYDKSDLEFLMSFSSLSEDHVDAIVRILSGFKLAVTDCSALDSELAIQELDLKDPVEAYALSSSLKYATFMFGAKGLCNQDEFEVFTNFDFEDRVINFSIGNKYLVQAGEVTPLNRLLLFFEIARTIAGTLKPLYGVIGPEAYSTGELSLERVESTGIRPFSMEELGNEALESASKSYGFYWK